MSHWLCTIIGHKPNTVYDAKRGNACLCWAYTSCKRCGASLDDYPIQHQWVEGYLENPCHYIKKCQNCGYLIFDYPRHEYDAAHPVLEGCTVHTLCTKCGAKSDPAIQHLYSEEIILEGCTAYQDCQRCGQRDSGTPAHAFAEPQQDGCVVSNTCVRCGHRVVLETLHEFKRVSSRESEAAQYLTTFTTFVCEKCGEEKVEVDGRYTDW